MCRDYPRARLAKQREVRNFLENSLEEDDLWTSYDRPTEALVQCRDRERPDFFWDQGLYGVVLEVDEDAHRNRPEFCECARMINIAQAEMRPIFFIRYNPDAYKPGNTVPPWFRRARLAHLLEWLRAALQEMPVRGASPGSAHMLQLFFDGFVQSTTTWTAVLPEAPGAASE